MRHVLKKGILIALLFTGINLSSGINLAYAVDNVNSIKLKSKCVKQNPLAAGQTDPELLSIYQQVCDKNNAARKNDLLVQAALRMYELNQPVNALALAQQLKQQNVRGAGLTDVTFLAGIGIAKQALQDMRTNEMRFLSNDLTYPPAKELSDTIRMAMPVPETINTKAITDETIKTREARSVVKSTKRTTTAKPSRNNNIRTAPVKARQSTATKQPNSASISKTGTNPFESLK